MDAQSALSALERLCQRLARTGAGLEDPQVAELFKHLAAWTRLLMISPQSQERAHRAWLAVARTSPAAASAHLLQCLQLEPPALTMVSECLDAILSSSLAWDALISVARASLKPEIVQQHQRCASLLTLVRLMERLMTISDIAAANELDWRHLVAVLNAFEAKRSPEQADMAVALFACLRKRLNPRWLTIVDFHIQAFAYAGRASDVLTIAAQYPDVLVGPKRERPADFLRSVAREERSAPPNDGDYRRLIEAKIREWRCS